MEPATKPPPDAERMTLADALQLALRLHRTGQLDEADALYRKILEADDAAADAWHFLGLLRYQGGHLEDGIGCVRRALAVQPEYPDAHANLGNMHVEMGDFELAERHLDTALLQAPDAVPPRIALAAIHRARGDVALAESLLRDALKLAPDRAEVHLALGRTLINGNQPAAGVQHLLKAAVLDPHLTGSIKYVGLALSYLGRLDEAAAFYRDVLAREPDNVEARHLLAACGGAPAPDRASDDYVRHAFDAFAASFDAQLARLEYRAPQLIAAACRQLLRQPDGSLRVLDAGCGTGLLGPLLRPWARTLAGVDLSPRMLERAAVARCYDELAEAELTAWLRGKPRAFDLVACADTLCYFGDLAPPLAATHDALTPGGWFLFTLEHAEAAGDGYAIQCHGRYAHRRDYVERTIDDAGFAEILVADGILRQDAGKPVAGLVLAAKKSSSN